MVIALAACEPDNGTPASNATATTTGFSTATPGGSISVWLLTTTPTLEGQPHQAVTPFAPVVAATDETQVTDAPPPLIPPDVTVPEQCPSLTAKGLPPDRPHFSLFAEVIRNFLASGGAPSVLDTGLRGWRAITSSGGLVRADVDLTGDGAPEILVIALDAAFKETAPQPGDLFVFSCQNKTVRLIYNAGYRPAGSAPVLFSADDINGDGIPDLIYTSQPCVTTGCGSEVHIVGWNATLSRISDLSGGPVAAYQPSVVVTDTSGPTKEISITSAANPDPAAGPPRSITTILRWDGNAFSVAQILKSPAQYRIQVIADADDALAAGDGASAIDLYLRAAEASDLLEWGIPDEATLLPIFARYRLMLAYTLVNRLDLAQAVHDQLITLYAPATSAPGQPTPFPISAPPAGIEFANMADLFWQNFAINRDMKRACTGVIEYARTSSAALIHLNSFGYNSQTYTAESMCPLGN